MYANSLRKLHVIVGDFLREFGMVFRNIRLYLGDDAPELVLHGLNYVGNGVLSTCHRNVRHRESLVAIRVNNKTLMLTPL